MSPSSFSKASKSALSIASVSADGRGPANAAHALPIVVEHIAQRPSARSAGRTRQRGLIAIAEIADHQVHDAGDQRALQQQAEERGETAETAEQARAGEKSEQPRAEQAAHQQTAEAAAEARRRRGSRRRFHTLRGRARAGLGHRSLDRGSRLWRRVGRRRCIERPVAAAASATDAGIGHVDHENHSRCERQRKAAQARK